MVYTKTLTCLVFNFELLKLNKNYLILFFAYFYMLQEISILIC